MKGVQEVAQLRCYLTEEMREQERANTGGRSERREDKSGEDEEEEEERGRKTADNSWTMYGYNSSSRARTQ